MSRLTSYDKEYREMVCKHEDCDVSEEYCPHLQGDCKCLREVIDKLAKYEDAEEQGLLEIIECHSKSDEGILTIVECHCEDCTCAVHVEGYDQTMYCERYMCHVQKKGFCNHASKRVPAAGQETSEIVENTKCETDSKCEKCGYFGKASDAPETVKSDCMWQPSEEDGEEKPCETSEKVLDAAEILNVESHRGMLIESDDLGNWGVKGLPWANLYVGQTITREIHDKLYGCLFKLMEYEATGLSPEEVERLQEDK